MIKEYKDLGTLSAELRKALVNKNCALIFAYNRVGKTRLSMEFRELGRDRNDDIEKQRRDTLYFNAFTEDLFIWDNDLKDNRARFLEINYNSHFFDGFEGRRLEDRIEERLLQYADFKFNINYNYKDEEKKDSNGVPIKRWIITFSRNGADNIKISRGEQNIFIWCVFLVLAELALDGDDSYNWVKYIYIDDPISSLDDGHAIAVACDLVNLLKEKNERQIETKKREDKEKNGKKINITKTIISTHHGLFFNVLCNEFGKNRYNKFEKYFLDKNDERSEYYLRNIGNTPFSYHVAMLGKLQNAIDDKELCKYHFNILRGIMETTAVFLGLKRLSDTVDLMGNIDDRDKLLFERTLQSSSHGGYPRYGPEKMSSEEATLFKNIFDEFVEYYEFDIKPFIKLQPKAQK